MGSQAFPDRRKRSRGLVHLPPERVKGAMFDTLMAAAPVSISFWDSELRFLRLHEPESTNQVTLRPAGRRFREVVGAGQLADHESMLRSVLRTGAEVVGLEISGLWPAGPDRHHLAGFHPVNGRAGERLGVAIVGLDVTSLRQAGQEENGRRQALEINDNVVQGLVVALMALELGEYQQAQAALESTLGRAREIIGDLISTSGGDLLLGPGRLLRRQPAPSFLQAGD